MNCASGGYKFASVLQCVGLVQNENEFFILTAVSFHFDVGTMM